MDETLLFSAECHSQVEGDNLVADSTYVSLVPSSIVRLVADLVVFKPISGRAVELVAGVSCNDLSHSHKQTHPERCARSYSMRRCAVA